MKPPVGLTAEEWEFLQARYGGIKILSRYAAAKVCGLRIDGAHHVEQRAVKKLVDAKNLEMAQCPNS